MTTSEVMKELGITKQALIFYEKEGLIKPARDANNYRSYSSEDLDVLKFILLMRTMEISIDEIKLILNNQLSIRDALEAKKEMIYVSKDKLDDISDKINQYMLRRKVNIVLDEEVNNEYENLYIHNDCFIYDDICILMDDIDYINIMIKATNNDHFFKIEVYYYISMDIVTNHDTYSFQLMNNKYVTQYFDRLSKTSIKINDPLNLMGVYNQYRNDMVGLNRYLNNHFKKWSKQYNLELQTFSIEDVYHYHSYLKRKK
ncbi:MAG: MerR family transcriptional regulator [Erysipelotrichaceae bacterium]|nr:MerR family transcriptional regulator [Erysipelotrichaceae bacterium]